MKTYLIQAVVVVMIVIHTVIVIMIVVASCKKDHLSPYGNNNGTPPVRKVRYELYTNENFAGDQTNITFSVFMRKPFMRNGQRTILDSALATMKAEDIPDFSHRIVIEKLVPGNDTATLVVGFNYYIENVYSSWYQEVFPPGDTLKVLKYPFQ